VRENYAAI